MRKGNRSASRYLQSAALALALGVPSAALSQEAPRSAPEDGAAQDDAIVVTAMKRGQDLQEVPASISAVSEEMLKTRAIGDLRDLSSVVPNITWGEHIGTTMLVIRGVGSAIDTGVTEPTVALYVDGVYLPRATMATLRTTDLERVEVLRGPNGTLYGRNATGGAINFISKAPSDSFEAGITAVAGSRDHYGVEGYVTGPLGDKVAVRLSGGFEKQDGYVLVRAAPQGPVTQKLNGIDSRFFRGALRFEPSDRFAADISVRYEESDTPRTFQQPFTPNPFAGPDQQTTEPNRIIANRPYADDAKTLVAAGTLTWEASDDITIKSITGYVDHKINAMADAEGTGFDLFHNEEYPRSSESIAQELTLSYVGDPFEAILGFYYFHEKSKLDLPTRLGFDGAPLFGVPPLSTLGQAVFGKNDSYAAYADATYHLSDRFALNAGLRINFDDQQLQQRYDLLIGPDSLPAVSQTADFRIKKTTALPKVALQFDPSDGIHTYLQWSRGYKSGGVNLPGGGAELLGNNLAVYRPETIDAWELGIKTQTGDRSLTANFAAYYYKYDDMQVSLVVPPAASQVNNADARVWGVEGELRWRPVDSFTLAAAGTYTHARFRNFGGIDEGQGVFVDLDGEPVPRAPDFTFNLSGDYVVPLQAGWLDSLTFSASLRYSDRLVLRYFGTDNDSQKAYAVADASVTLHSERAGLDATLYVKNITDKLYKQNVAIITGAYVGNYAPPRSWGIRLTKTF